MPCDLYEMALPSPVVTPSGFEVHMGEWVHIQRMLHYENALIKEINDLFIDLD